MSSVALKDTRETRFVYNSPRAEDTQPRIIQVELGACINITPNSSDPFMKSAAYFAMTGRKGLWLYSLRESFMFVAKHPNTPQSYMAFPPQGPDKIDLLNYLRSDPRFADGELQVGRIALDDTALLGDLREAGFSEPAQEKVLDWAYPVHIISTQLVSSYQGHGFSNFRAHIRQAANQEYRPEMLRPDLHARDILSIVNRWADSTIKNGFNKDDLITPTLAALRLMAPPNGTIKGLIVYKQNEPVAYWIWDECSPQDKMAVSLVRVSTGHLTGLKGTAEYLALKVCEKLKDHGFESLCLGGSETANLDHFKRKLNPVRSIAMGTVRPTVS